jgi:predicted nucleic-acid-binding Zn-ribbon protein
MIWDMLCPKCESDNYYHPDMQFEGDIIMAHFICIDCGHGFDVIFDNPILINE